MADYWKSNERKYCTFCKCWIADNKASIAFHEDGKRHKATVAKRITEISVNSAKAERQQQKMDSEIRKMEDAALKAYARDICASSDMTARSINTVMLSAGSVDVAPGTSGIIGPTLNQKQIDPMRLTGDLSDDEDRFKYAKTIAEPEQSHWIEGRTEDGHTYYWNVKTSESVWNKPKEGFMSLAEYDKINQIALSQQKLLENQEAKKLQSNIPEEVAKYNREKLKVFRKLNNGETSKAVEEKRNTYKTEEEAANPDIGQWVVVEEKKFVEEKPVDLQLPVNNDYYVPVVSQINSEPPEKKFKEKTITSLIKDEDYSNISSKFKKRKIPRGNARQRTNDDD